MHVRATQLLLTSSHTGPLTATLLVLMIWFKLVLSVRLMPAAKVLIASRLILLLLAHVRVVVLMSCGCRIDLKRLMILIDHQTTKNVTVLCDLRCWICQLDRSIAGSLFATGLQSMIAWVLVEHGCLLGLKRVVQSPCRCMCSGLIDTYHASCHFVGQRLLLFLSFKLLLLVNLGSNEDLRAHTQELFLT